MGIRLKAPQGVDTVAFGGESYAVADGVVEVSEAAAAYLYQYGFQNLPPEKTAKQKADPDA